MREVAENQGQNNGVLSQRQAQCLALASDGLTSKEIARQIGISPSTVDNHLRVAAAKLQVSGRRAAVRRVKDHHEPEQPAPEVILPPQQTHWSTPPTIGIVPPLGGEPNTLPPSRRFMLVLRVALLTAMVLAALTTTITGIVYVLSH